MGHMKHGKRTPSCIPSLSCLHFFLYNPYMPLFLIRRIFKLLVIIQRGDSALLIAIMMGYYEVVSWLIEAGANPDLQDKVSKLSCTCSIKVKVIISSSLT